MKLTFLDGDEYSFVNYVGDQRLGIASVSAKINFLKDGLVFKIPVFFIQGEEDIQTPSAINKEYFKNINATVKMFFRLPKTDRGFNQLVVDKHYDI